MKHDAECVDGHSVLRGGIKVCNADVLQIVLEEVEQRWDRRLQGLVRYRIGALDATLIFEEQKHAQQSFQQFLPPQQQRTVTGGRTLIKMLGPA